jgi:hypothetical protein
MCVHEVLVKKTGGKLRRLFIASVCFIHARAVMNIYYIRCEGNRDAASLIRGLLEPNPATRLGNGAKGWSAITSHPFFTQPQPLGSGGGKGGVGDGKEGGDGKEEGGGDWVDPIDWDRLVTRQVPAPFKPEVRVVFVVDKKNQASLRLLPS